MQPLAVEIQWWTDQSIPCITLDRTCVMRDSAMKPEIAALIHYRFAQGNYNDVIRLSEHIFKEHRIDLLNGTDESMKNKVMVRDLLSVYLKACIEVNSEKSKNTTEHVFHFYECIDKIPCELFVLM